MVIARIADGVVVNIAEINNSVSDAQAFINRKAARGETWIVSVGTDGAPTQKNIATIGGLYDASRSAFISLKPFPSWVLDEVTCQYEAPVPHPGGDVEWNESVVNWVVA